jgi:hypothetical protein
MQNKFLTLLLALGLGLIASCNEDDLADGGDTPSSGSCAIASGELEGICIDYGEGYTTATAELSCDESSGTYATTACTSTGLVGSCTVSQEGLSVVMRFFAPYTAGVAEAACDSFYGSEGTFEPAAY